MGGWLVAGRFGSSRRVGASGRLRRL